MCHANDEAAAWSIGDNNAAASATHPAANDAARQYN
jgi:hypothetical protein